MWALMVHTVQAIVGASEIRLQLADVAKRFSYFL